MQKLIISFIISYLLTYTCFGQFPTKLFGQSGTDRGVGISSTNDGSGYLIAGFTTSYGVSGEDIYLVKTKLDGELVWERTFGGAGDDNAWSIKQSHDNNYIIVGFTNSYSVNGDWDIQWLKIDETGNELDSRVYNSPGDQFAWEILPTSEGDYLIAGQTADTTGAGQTSTCLKINHRGEILWRFQLPSENPNRAFSAIELNNTYFITGLIETEKNGLDGFVVSLSSEGEKKWIRNYGGGDDDICHGINLSHDGNLIISGYSKSFSNDKNSPWLIKLNTDGEEIWSNSYGSLLEERIVSSVVGINGQITLLGYVFKKSDVDLLIVQTDHEGQLLQMITLGSPKNDEASQTVILNSNNQVVYSGRTYQIKDRQGDLFLMVQDLDRD